LQPASRWDQARDRASTVTAGNDGNPPYNSAQLERMNRRFIERLKRAIRAGRESMTAATREIAGEQVVPAGKP
jgi:hypothetical protein